MVYLFICISIDVGLLHLRWFTDVWNYILILFITLHYIYIFMSVTTCFPQYSVYIALNNALSRDIESLYSVNPSLQFFSNSFGSLRPRHEPNSDTCWEKLRTTTKTHCKRRTYRYINWSNKPYCLLKWEMTSVAHSTSPVVLKSS